METTPDPTSLEAPESARTATLEAVLHAVEYSATYSGPVPHPAILKRFEELLPGSAERLFREFEVQAEHRRSLERRVIASDTLSQALGSFVSR